MALLGGLLLGLGLGFALLGGPLLGLLLAPFLFLCLLLQEGSQEGDVGKFTEHGEQAVADPVHAQGGGEGEADPQGEQGHDDHGGLHGLVHGVLSGVQDVGVDVVGHQHGDHAQGRGDDGDEPQGKGLAHVLLLPEEEMRGLGEVDPQEAEVDDRHVGQLGDGGYDLVVVQKDVLGDGQLAVALVVHDGSVEQVGDGVELVLVDAHEVFQGLADDQVQHHQEGQGEEGPQAAAGGLDTLLLIELLQLLAVFLPVSGVFLGQLPLLVRQAAHGEHALAPLQKDGEEDQTDDQTEQQQGDAIAACPVVEQQDQFRERG